ncbi:zinc-binding alcohol dehydrogenase family protein [Paucibacter sp. M5-1]|uniref:zinc-binding alcohol dehydrogenase family protein n=1 Tax=Paucibacter sp. M5-1 TaxID=3015998 RepID=UPI0022B8D129|nr:zinc-binding alcohol dehydrogenase family protein [Paucibacter sp. M5-1]MCZ7880551.1 zinc-binding alcohol dehydrogenase family protein [Paucibacter sp. M5-1]
MKAIVSIRHSSGTAAELIEQEVPDPVIKPHDLLVRPLATASNPVDYKVKDSTEPGLAPRILGWDAVGEVLGCGIAVIGFRPGDLVWYAGDINRPGAYAELQAVDSRIAARAPSRIDPIDAASLPLTVLTAWELLIERFRVQQGAQGSPGTLLIIGGAGGVGSALIQIARALTNVKVIVTASRPESVDWVSKLGAHHVINFARSWPEQLSAIGVRQVDYIASLTASDEHLLSAAQVIKPFGSYGLIDDPKSLDISVFKRKSVSIHWELMFTKTLFEGEDLSSQGQILHRVSELVDLGQIRSTRLGSGLELSASSLQQSLDSHQRGSSRGKQVFSRPKHWR